MRNRKKSAPAAPVKAPAKKSPAAPAVRTVRSTPAPRPPAAPASVVPVSDEAATDLDALAAERDVMLRRCVELTADEMFHLAVISKVLEDHAVAADDSARNADLERVRAEMAAAAAADAPSD